jgi:hypothetical protein
MNPDTAMAMYRQQFDVDSRKSSIFSFSVFSCLLFFYSLLLAFSSIASCYSSVVPTVLALFFMMSILLMTTSRPLSIAEVECNGTGFVLGVFLL